MTSFEELIASWGEHPNESARRFQTEVMSQPVQQQEESYRLSEEDIEELSNTPIEPPQEQQVVGIIAVQQFEEDNSEPEDADAEEIEDESPEEEDAVSAREAFSSELASLQAERENEGQEEQENTHFAFAGQGIFAQMEEDTLRRMEEQIAFEEVLARQVVNVPPERLEFHRNIEDNSASIAVSPSDDSVVPEIEVPQLMPEDAMSLIQSGEFSVEQAVTAISNNSTEVENTAENAQLLSPNSPFLLREEATSRFSGAEWFEEIKNANIIIAGLGGIGSWTALLLGRMVPERLTLYDGDTVEIANMSGQLYGWSRNEQPKATAMTNIIREYTNSYNCFGVRGNYTEETPPGPIMICGFDNMIARKTFFRSWKGYVNRCSEPLRSKCLYIDGRLGFDTLQVLCIQGDDTYNIERYEREFLFDDSQAEETICSMKQTSYMAAMIGSVIVNLFTNYMANRCNPDAPYDLPFFTQYDSQNMLFKTEY